MENCQAQRQLCHSETMQGFWLVFDQSASMNKAINVLHAKTVSRTTTEWHIIAVHGRVDVAEPSLGLEFLWLGIDAWV